MWIGLAVVLVALAGAESIARSVVGDRMAADVGCRLGVEPEGVDAHLGAVPLTPRMVTGSLGDLAIEDAVGRLGEDEIAAEVDVHLDGVDVGWWGQDSLTADSGRAVLDIKYENLPTGALGGQSPGMGAGMPTSLYGEDGMLVIDLGMAVMKAELRTEDDVVMVAPTTLQVGGQEIPVEVARDLISARAPGSADMLADREMPLPDLPDGVSLQEVVAGDDKLRITTAFAPEALASATESCATASANHPESLAITRGASIDATRPR